MKTIILLLSLLLFVCPFAYPDGPGPMGAEEVRDAVVPEGMTLQEVIAWKYGAGKAETVEGKIVNWIDTGTTKPTEDQLDLDIAEYKTHIETLANQKKNRKQAVMQKLGLSKGDIQGLVELIQDQSDE